MGGGSHTPEGLGLLLAAPRETAHPPPALPEGCLGPMPGVRFRALHHSCRPHPQGPLLSRAGGSDPSQPPFLPQGMGPLAQSISLQTLGPQQAKVHTPFYRGGGRSYPGEKFPRIKELLKGGGRAWRTLWETPHHPKVGGVHSLLQTACVQGYFPPHSEPYLSVAATPILSQLTLPWAQGHIVQKAPVGQVDGDSLTHTFWSPTRHPHSRLNKAGLC